MKRDEVLWKTYYFMMLLEKRFLFYLIVRVLTEPKTQSTILMNGRWDGSTEKHAKFKLDHKCMFMLIRLRVS